MVFSRDLVGGLVRFCEDRGIHAIMDDIYHKLVFDGVAAPSCYEFTRKGLDESSVIVINGIAKTYGMTGFRIGWAIASRDVVSSMATMQSQTTSCVSSLCQVAAEGAMLGPQDEVEALRKCMEHNRNVIVEELAKLPGLRSIKPQGTFYCLPDFSAYLSPRTATDSFGLSTFLLSKARVVTIPGKDFGLEGYLRLSYAGSTADVVEGVDADPLGARPLHAQGNPHRGEDGGARLAVTMDAAFVADLREIVGPDFVRADEEARAKYGQDGLKRGHLAELVVIPGTTSEVAAVAEACNARRVPLVVRGGGTGYSGGSVPLRGGVLLSMERFNRILEIDEENLLAVVEPNVVTGDFQAAVEALGLFYPPDPASLQESVIGGNIAECGRGAARLQVRHDQAIRPRPRGGAADRRDDQDRVEGGQERRRLRPDAAAGRVRGDARDRHAGRAAAGSQAAGADRQLRARSPRCEAAVRGRHAS